LNVFMAFPLDVSLFKNKVFDAAFRSTVTRLV
jgi:hypothetical protein